MFFVFLYKIDFFHLFFYIGNLVAEQLTIAIDNLIQHV